MHRLAAGILIPLPPAPYRTHTFHRCQCRYAAPQLAKNVLGVTEVAGFAYGSPVAATPDDGSFDDDDYVDPDARREAASAPVAMATPGYGKPVHPAAPLLIDEAEELYDIPSITSTSAAAGSDLPAEDAEAMYENADAEGMSAAQRLAAGSDLPAEDAEAMYGNTDAAGMATPTSFSTIFHVFRSSESTPPHMHVPSSTYWAPVDTPLLIRC